MREQSPNNFISKFIFFILIKYPDKIIRWLQLDKGIDDEFIDFRSLKNESIIKLTLLIVGGFLIVDNIAPLLSYSYYAFKTDVAGMFVLTQHDNINWIASAGNVIIGFMLITNYVKITEWMSEKVTPDSPNQDMK